MKRQNYDDEPLLSTAPAAYRVVGWAAVAVVSQKGPVRPTEAK
jgi:hypothetical protein